MTNRKDTNLGKLERVPLRDIWKNEAGDFTPWLALEENIQILGEAIGIELEVQAQEKAVGPYSADILCKDTSTEEWVLIENQLEKTDHTHLGQLLTYAAGLDAVKIVWVAARITDEHRAALDWLNEKSDENINFFGVEIELWKIGKSEIAPKFNIVSKPNDWAKTVKTSRSKRELSETQLLQLEFWTAFKSYMEEAESKIRCGKPQAWHWMDHSLGRSGFGMGSVASVTWNSETGKAGSEIRVDVVVNDSAKYFDLLETQKAEIEKELGFSLKWINEEENKTAKMVVRRDANVSDKTDWSNQHKWLGEKLEILDDVLRPRIKGLPN